MAEPVLTENQNNNSREPFYKHHRFPLVIVSLLFLLVVGLFIYSLVFSSSRKVNVKPTSNLEQIATQQTTELTALNAQLTTNPTPQAEAQFIQKAKARLDTIHKLLDDEQVSQTLALAKPGQFSNAPEQAQPYIEKQTTISGKLYVIHGEKFDEKGYVEGSEHHKFWVGATPPHGKRLYLTEENVQPGSTIKVKAVQFNTLFAASTNQVTQTAAAASTFPSQMKIAVVLLRKPGTTTNPYTVASVDAAFFGATNSVANYFSQQSGGQTTVTGQVFGWWSGSTTTCSLSQTDDAIADLTAHGVNLSNFNYFASVTNLACNYSGLAFVPGNKITLDAPGPSTVYFGVAGHELGHNLGNFHAGKYTCADLTCQAEYGDPDDTMGDAYGHRHFNAFHKYSIGWLPSSKVVSLNSTSGTQTFTLTPQENPVDAGATKLIIAQNQTGPKYVIEYRKAVGYDSGTANGHPPAQGVWVRRAERVASDDTLLPYNPVVLGVGKSLVDSTNKLTFKTISDSGSSAQVQVCMGTCAAPPPSCTASAPTVSVAPSTVSLAPGTVQAYAVSVKNNDSSACSSVTFSLATPSLPIGFSQSINGNSSVTLAPGASGTINVNITSPIYQAKATSNNIVENISASGGHSGGSATTIYGIPAVFQFFNCGHC